MTVATRGAMVLFTMVTVACSGSSTPSAPPPSTPATTVPPSVIAAGGLGRLPDAPIVACAHDRASVPLAAEATPSECRSDADCTAGQNGRCLRISNHGSHGPSLEGSSCSYDGCFADAECGAGSTCSCGHAAGELGTGHSCVVGYCTTDAECGARGYCRRTDNGTVCHTLDDTCAEETLCGVGMRCNRIGAGPWTCMPFTPPTG